VQQLEGVEEGVDGGDLPPFDAEEVHDIDVDRVPRGRLAEELTAVSAGDVEEGRDAVAVDPLLDQIEVAVREPRYDAWAKRLKDSMPLIPSRGDRTGEGDIRIQDLVGDAEVAGVEQVLELSVGQGPVRTGRTAANHHVLGQADLLRS
jgi:hypothetical protein